MESTSFRCGGKLLPVVFFNLLLSRAGEMEVVLQCKNDVCVGALSINFTKLLFYAKTYFVSCIALLVSRGCY